MKPARASASLGVRSWVMPPTDVKRVPADPIVTDDRFTAPVLLLTGICALIYFLDGLIHSILGPLAPEMARSLRLSNAQLGPIFSANLIGQCVGLIGFPMLAGRSGQRMVVIVCVAGFGIAQSATALADGPTGLFIWRLITGAFLGGCLPSCLALVTTAAPAKRRGLAIMMLFTGYGLGATVAGLVATGFVHLGGWRMAMVAVGGVCLVTAVFAWMRLQEPPSKGGEAAAQGDNRDDNQGNDRCVGNAGSSNALLLLSPRYALGTLLLWLLFISMLTVSYCLNSWLPTLLVEVGRSERFAAMSISVFSLGGIIAALGVGLLIDRFGTMRTLIAFTSISTALLFALGEVLATASAGVLMALLAACGCFVLGAYGGVNVVLASYYPDHLLALGIGWSKSVGRLGTVITPVLIGAGLSAGMAETTIMSLFAVPALLSVLALAGIAVCTRRRD
jgi:MFS transporter, AAHS family, 4-hydroxybenzoate transporter